MGNSQLHCNYYTKTILTHLHSTVYNQVYTTTAQRWSDYNTNVIDYEYVYYEDVGLQLLGFID